jgi:hypothetical protein
MEVYLSGTGDRVPTEAVDELLNAAGCHVIDWGECEIEILDGAVNLGNGRVQPSLF